MPRIGRVKLLKKIKHNDKWVFAPALFDSKARVRRDHVAVEGRDVLHPEGVYFLQWWKDGTRTHEAVGADAFLAAVEADADWSTRSVTTGRPMQTLKARMLMDKIAEGTWLCGDPGMQYEDTIQRWHTCPNTAPINSSNPCS